MLQKSLTLVGLVAVLVLVGSSVNWAAQGQQGVSLDPGQTATDNATREALIAEALPAIIQAGYQLKEFDFERAVAEPEGKALFVPVKDLAEKLKKLPALIGLLYVNQPIALDGGQLAKGIYPLQVSHTGLQQSTSESQRGRLRFAPTQICTGFTMWGGIDGDCFGALSQLLQNWPAPEPSPPPRQPPPTVPPSGGGGKPSIPLEGLGT